MEELVKISVGIDCGNDHHVANLSGYNNQETIVNVGSLKFLNSTNGFNKFFRWLKKLHVDLSKVVFVLEVTGVYHEQMASELFDLGYNVCVVLPYKSKHFSKTIDIKTMNDFVAAYSLAVMGLEKKLDRWNKPDPFYLTLKQLTREKEQLVHESTQIKNQLHAENASAWPNQASVRRMNQRIKFIKKQIAEIESELHQIVKETTSLKVKIDQLCSIKGVGFITAITVIAETSGFNLIRNKKQLVSYAGLDVVEKTSGTSVRGKSHISKHGNKYLRKCLHFPALTAIRHSQKAKDLFVRLVSKHGIKMKAVVAVQRKLLVLMYILWKNNSFFDPEYEHTKSENELGQSQRTALMELA